MMLIGSLTKQLTELFLKAMNSQPHTWQLAIKRLSHTVFSHE